MAEAEETKVTPPECVTHQKTVFIVGYTGASGRALVKYLDQHKTFSKVRLIGRREVDLKLENADMFEQIVVDFDKLEDFSDAFKDVAVGYCTLGTTPRPIETFRRVDRDYVLKVGEMAKAAGCQYFGHLSGKGADKDSSISIMKIKGEAEAGLKDLHFDRLMIYKPIILLADREVKRARDGVVKFLLSPFVYFFPTTLTVPVETVAKAMVLNSLAPSEQTVEIISNKAIHEMAAGGPACPQ